MTSSISTSFIPEKFRILSGSALKTLAMIIMLIDHTASFLLRYYPPANSVLFQIGNTNYSLYRIMRDIGRAAFPIFCFLLVEGFLHTHNCFKYGRNLLIFACISEIPWNFAQNGTIIYPDKQNVFFTLFLGYLAFCLIEHFEKNASMQFICLLALLAVSFFLKADYGYKGFVFLLIMYCLHPHKPAQAVIGSCWLIYEWKACFAFLSLNMYNGKRGFIQGKWTKYFFYAFYPVHIGILAIIRKLWFGI